jgi:hypothetical protein
VSVAVRVAARSLEHGRRFLERNPALKGARIDTNVSSLFSWINEIVSENSGDVALLVHDDTTFADISLETVSALVSRLPQTWGLCGNAGTILNESRSTRRYIIDPHGGPIYDGDILPAETIDGNTILINVALLKQRSVVLPIIDNYHLYDIVLSLECLRAGLKVFIVPQLACYHSSGGSGAGFTASAQGEMFLRYLGDRGIRKLVTVNGEIVVPSEFSVRGVRAWNQDVSHALPLTERAIPNVEKLNAELALALAVAPDQTVDFLRGILPPPASQVAISPLRRVVRRAKQVARRWRRS